MKHSSVLSPRETDGARLLVGQQELEPRDAVSAEEDAEHGRRGQEVANDDAPLGQRLEQPFTQDRDQGVDLAAGRAWRPVPTPGRQRSSRG